MMFPAVAKGFFRARNVVPLNMGWSLLERERPSPSSQEDLSARRRPSGKPGKLFSDVEKTFP